MTVDLARLMVKFFFFSFFIWLPLFSKNIGLLVVGTGKYIEFVKPLIESADKFFCTNHDVTYIVFTDSEYKGGKNVRVVHQPRLGWPYDTMMRFHAYYKNQAVFSDQDYLFACDADMLFVDHVGDEILGERVATLHPGFVGKRGSYESRMQSNAYVSPFEGKNYYAGGFYGGSLHEFLKGAKTNLDRIDDDLEHGLIAVWHDESHWNRYCVDNPPTIILSPSYCYPESWHLNYQKKLLALDKNHNEIRK